MVACLLDCDDMLHTAAILLDLSVSGDVDGTHEAELLLKIQISRHACVTEEKYNAKRLREW